MVIQSTSKGSTVNMANCIHKICEEQNLRFTSIGTLPECSPVDKISST